MLPKYYGTFPGSLFSYRLTTAEKNSYLYSRIRLSSFREQTDDGHEEGSADDAAYQVLFSSCACFYHTPKFAIISEKLLVSVNFLKN